MTHPIIKKKIEFKITLHVIMLFQGKCAQNTVVKSTLVEIKTNSM